jgi:hypothetical protein
MPYLMSCSRVSIAVASDIFLADYCDFIERLSYLSYTKALMTITKTTAATTPPKNTREIFWTSSGLAFYRHRRMMQEAEYISTAHSPKTANKSLLTASA